MIIEANEQIGKYRIIGELGRGGMGVVYLAEDVNLTRRVSLKMLQGAIAQDGVFKDGFRREARLVSRVVHPNVVQIYSLDEIDGNLFIDMEYVEGQSLGQLMNEGPIPLPLTAHIAMDVLQGLSVCHQAGIIHRDIKPSNILLTTTGQSKIVDFGIASALADSGAQVLEQSESTMMFMGTPRYTPPEAWDEKPVDARWDLYALGVMLHEMVTGRVAYESRTMLSLMREIVTQPLPPIDTRVDEISSPFAKAIDGMVHPDPERRLGSADEAMEMIRASTEAKSYTSVDSPTITVALPKTPIRGMDAEPTTMRLIMRAAFIAVPLLLIVTGALWISAEVPEVGGSGVEAGSFAGGLTGFDLSAADVVSPDIWFAREVGSESAREWHLYQEGGAALGEVLYAFNDRSLAYLTVIQDGDSFAVEGSWAEYRTVAGIGFQAGTIHGSGIRHHDGLGYTMTLRFESDRDRRIREETYYVSPSTEFTDRRAYVEAIECAPWLSALLVHEIRPRHLALGDAIGQLFPSAPGQFVIAPLVAEAKRPQELDGDLSDEIWARQFFGDSGRMGDFSGDDDTGPLMHVRHDGESIFVGFTVDVGDANDAMARLSIRQQVEKPLGNSERTDLTVRRNGESELRHFVGETESRIPETWSVQQSSDEGRWTLELSIPITEELRAQFGTDVVDSVRLNCAVEAGEETIAVWGDTTSSRVEHGAVVVLESKGRC